MFLAMMSGCRQAVLAVRAEPIDERCKAQPDPQPIRDLEAIERRAMEALIAGQLVWGSYWAIIELWFGAGSMTREASPQPSGNERPSVRTPSSPMLMAAE